MTQTRLYTADDLWEMGADAPYIVIDGELIDEVSASPLSSRIAAKIVGENYVFTRQRRLGDVFGADGTYIFKRNPDTVLSPDASFVRAERMPPIEGQIKFFPFVPDLAVGVLSPSNRPGENARKVAIYRESGVPLVWFVDPQKRTVIVYAQGEEPRTLGVGDALDGGAVLPGLSLPLADLFA